jgi:phage baseplate assembly protein W
MLPEYGTNIRKHLFELDDVQTKEAIQREVLSAVARWEPRVEIQNIEVRSDTRAGHADFNALKIQIEFIIDEYPLEVQELTLVL